MNIKKLYKQIKLDSANVKTKYKSDDFDMAGIKFGKGLVNLGLDFKAGMKDKDKNAATEFYTELITRPISTTLFDSNSRSDRSDLVSLFGLFELVRKLMKKYGYGSEAFSQLAVVFLNGVIRPFTSQWHSRLDELSDNIYRPHKEFRAEFMGLQIEVEFYIKLIADMAGLDNVLSMAEIEGNKKQ